MPSHDSRSDKKRFREGHRARYLEIGAKVASCSRPSQAIVRLEDANGFADMPYDSIKRWLFVV
jgi:hypothetical protein